MIARERSLLIFIVITVIFVLGLTSNIYAPSFPAMSTAFQTSDQSIQSSIVIYFGGYTLGILFLGPIFDAFGRKKPLLCGLIGYFITSLLCGFSKTIQVFLLLRGLQGLGGAILGISFRSILRDAFSGKDLSKAMSYISAFYRVGPITAPLLGGYLQMYFGWQANFFALAVYIAFVIYLVVFHLKETHLERTPIDWMGTMVKYKQILTHLSFFGAAICWGIQYGMLLLVNLFGSFFIQNILGHTAVSYGHIAFSIGIFIIAGNLCNRFLLHYTSEMKLIFYGVIINILLALVQVGFAWVFPKNLWSFFVPISAILFFCGFIASNMVSRAMNLFERGKGKASALQGLIAMIAAMFVTFSVLFVPIKSIFPFACLFGGLNLLVFVIYKWMFLKEKPRH